MVKRKVHEPGKRSLRAFLCTCVTAAFVLVGTNAFALSGKLGETGMIDVDTTLNYDVNWRADSMDPKLATTGNRNFEKGALVQNAVSILVDEDRERFRSEKIFERTCLPQLEFVLSHCFTHLSAK